MRLVILLSLLSPLAMARPQAPMDTTAAGRPPQYRADAMYPLPSESFSYPAQVCHYYDRAKGNFAKRICLADMVCHPSTDECVKPLGKGDKCNSKDETSVCDFRLGLGCLSKNYNEDGKCVNNKASLGQPCIGAIVGVYCDYATTSCLPQPDGSRKCVPRGKEGDTCLKYDRFCQLDLTCVQKTPDAEHKCVKGAAIGQPCSPEKHCVQSAFCFGEGAAAVCKKLPAAGEACPDNRCSHGLSCHWLSKGKRTCYGMAKRGEVCVDQVNCASRQDVCKFTSGTADTGICSAPVPKDGACFGSNECVAGHFCEGNSWVQPEERKDKAGKCAPVKA